MMSREQSDSEERSLMRSRRTPVWLVAFTIAASSTLLLAAQPQEPQTPPVSTGRGGRGGPQEPRRDVGPADRPRVDPAAADRGRSVWTAECLSCHGEQARGTANGPSLLRSAKVTSDRGGTVLGPFFKAGHPMTSGKASASLTDAQVIDLLHFILQRRNDTLRGSALFDVQNILTGDAKAGAEYFNGAGGCTSCHSVTGNLAGIAARFAPVDLQQRMLFPSGRGGRGRASAQSNAAAVTVTITPPAGASTSGVLMQMDDFFVTFRDASGVVRVVRRSPDVKIVTVDPLQAHHELLDRITDTNIHDLVAYLETLK